MSGRTAVLEDTRSSSLDRPADRLGPLAILLLSPWCGLISGLLEVGVTVVRKWAFDLNHFYWQSRHFTWIVPLTDLMIFLALGLPLALLAWRGGRRGRWLAPRLLGALTLLPPIWAAFPRIFGPAGVLLALGGGMRLAIAAERHPAGLRRAARFVVPPAIVLLAILAARPAAEEWIGRRREASRPLPPAGSANVLLLVLDTVSADHLSLYGYDRPTSPTIDELAGRGVRFDRARATSSWTLPSHASLLTGRWPHELSAGWLTPLDAARPTLAEFLGSRGYATVGFAANPWYCAWDSGLARGFTVYRDAIFPRLTAFKSAVLISRPLDGIQALQQFLDGWLDLDWSRGPVRSLWWLFHSDRKEAEVLNREFLDWLARRPQPDRPFFAFLNYYDAHHPYQLAELGIHRFSVKADDEGEVVPLDDALLPTNVRPSQQQVARDRDAYDDCIADLDERLGRLIDELDRRAILEHTWLIVVADHGESFGEHPGVFHHGTSLYRTELHVPLLIVPPATAGIPSPRVVGDVVSLKDLPATILDSLGLREGSPFPGEPLVRFGDRSPQPAPSGPTAREPALSEVVPLDGLNPDPAQLLERRWPMAALTDDNWTYIRREGEVREELYRSGDDRREQHDLAADPALRPTLERLRRNMERLTAGPLTKDRFNP